MAKQSKTKTALSIVGRGALVLPYMTYLGGRVLHYKILDRIGLIDQEDMDSDSFIWDTCESLDKFLRGKVLTKDFDRQKNDQEMQYRSKYPISGTLDLTAGVIMGLSLIPVAGLVGLLYTPKTDLKVMSGDFEEDN